MSDPIPKTYQEISTYVGTRPGFNLFELRKRTFDEIEKITGNPLICYVSKTSNVQPGLPVSIDDDDIIGFSDLISTTTSDSIDIFIISNGGSPVSAERIIKLLHSGYKHIRFIVTGNAYSAATIMCFSADSIIMHGQGTLGPIDPQINGIPAYAILKSFEEVEKRLKEEGPSSLTAYMPLISKYDLHLFNICRNAQLLSEELAKQYLKDYMFKETPKTDDEISNIVQFFMDHGLHKSHGRSIDRCMAEERGLTIIKSESIPNLDDLLLSLFKQYQLFLMQSPFYKLYENSRGINWGRMNQQFTLPLSGIPQPQQGLALS
jgi:hypothetical protein